MTLITTRLGRLHLVMVPSRDPDRSIAFHASLGFEKRADGEMPGGHRWVELFPPDGTAGIALVPGSDDASDFSKTRRLRRTILRDMDQRLNVMTLGVADVPRARAFYERLGWKLGFTDDDIVMFQAGPMIISLWSREKLADDSGIAEAGDGWGGFTLGHAVGDAGEVDALCAAAADAGATVTSTPKDKGFGYSGVFADPDGHTWEIAWIKALVRHPDGSVELPS